MNLPAPPATSEYRKQPIGIWRQLLQFVQIAAACLVVHTYAIEGPQFVALFLLGAAGFCVSVFLPTAVRLPFFVLLSLAATFQVLGLQDGLWLIGGGLTLVGLCRLPLSVGKRIFLLLTVTAFLVAARAGLATSPWSELVWPILGSMFMFRLVIYLRAIRHDPTTGGIWPTLGYFFMFPNLAFPLFPVIDYQTFRGTYFDRAEQEIYQQGLMWIARGLVHLVLYRLVYHQIVIDPEDVHGLGDLVQFMLGTFLLYLKVSGTFHLIVGMLHLFGFRLPETHRHYFLAQGFMELWRRINIYWKDFMMSLVFYPVYFRVKAWGQQRAIIVATSAVFVATWFLHSYQWFWLRGGFPVTAQDMLFWGLLGGLVIYGAVREIKHARSVRSWQSGWNLRGGLRAAFTFAAFCFLWSLWSAESIGEWLWILGAVARPDLKGLLLLAGMMGAIILLGSFNWEAASNRGPAWMAFIQRPDVRTVASLAILLALATPGLQALVPRAIEESLQATRTTGMNQRDSALKHRGYYEQLDVRHLIVSEGAETEDTRRRTWQDLAGTGVLRIRDDFLERDLLPSQRITWNGKSFSTNRWGMRDQEYSLVKPARTLRIALLGPSHVMGNGVADHETFESIVEKRLNHEFRLSDYERYEILNFGVDGYCTAQQVAQLENRVLAFSPDVVISTMYHANRTMTQAFLRKLIVRGLEIPYPEVRKLLASAGLDHFSRYGTPVPFPAWRRAAGYFGIQTRMPHAEIEARIRRIAEQTADWSVTRLAEVAYGSGVQPVFLLLDAVLDTRVAGLPSERAIVRTGAPVFNLLDVFPSSSLNELRVAPWDDHPNAAGHALIADRMYPVLTEFLVMEFNKQ